LHLINKFKKIHEAVENKKLLDYNFKERLFFDLIVKVAKFAKNCVLKSGNVDIQYVSGSKVIAGFFDPFLINVKT
jgi:hypothetical protein